MELDINDPVLRSAYRLAIDSGGVPAAPGYPPRFIAEWMLVAYNDLVRRGDEAFPLLMDIMVGTRDPSLKAFVLRTAGVVGSVDVTPFIDYWRSLIREQTNDLNSAIEIAVPTFFFHGEPSDVELLRWLVEVRPDIADAVCRPLDGWKEGYLRMGKPVSEEWMDWDLSVRRNEIAPEEITPGMTSAEFSELLLEHQQKMDVLRESVDPSLLPQPGLEALIEQVQLDPNSGNYTQADQSTSSRTKDRTTFVVVFAICASAIMAGAWLVLRQKSA